MMPRVTVLMPVYNVEKYVSEAINSILNQTFTDFELLILDDCSTDGTAEIIRSFSDPRVRYVKQKKNVGLADNLNTGIELSETEYLARMDGDDISVASCLEKQIRFLDAHPEVGVCGAGFRFFGTKNDTIFFPEKNEEIKAEQLFGCGVIQPMLRRKILIDNNLRYKTSAFPAEDYRLWAEFLRVAQAHTLQEVLFHYRMHAGQISTEKRQLQIEKSNEARLLMLEWLSPDFSTEEKQYFIETFVPANITKQEKWKVLKNFAQLIEQKNEKQKVFEPQALHARLQKHINDKAYYVAVKIFFPKKFLLKNYIKFLRSDVAKDVQKNLSVKIFAKSLLRKNSYNS